MPGRVLVLAYHFPPVGGVGVQRTLKYVTYLPRFGWESIVVAPRDPGVAAATPDDMAAVPDRVRVERVASPEPVKLRRGLGRAVRAVAAVAPEAIGGRKRHKARVEPFERAGGVASLVRSASPRNDRRGVAVPAALRRAWASGVRSSFFPDEQLAWAPFAALRGLSVARDGGVDAIYSSSAPISAHLAAGLVASRTGLPWVADFRDPWLGNAFAARPGRLHGWLQRRIERRIVSLASRSVFATEAIAEMYRCRYPDLAGRFVAIPNGYDRSDHVDPAPRPGDGRFRLVYAGSIYGEDELAMFLDGLELAVERHPELRSTLDVEFVGWLNLHNQAVAARYATPERLASVLTFSGFVPHADAMARLASADALLQIIGDGPNKGQIQGGKLMEYLGFDRQILAVVPEGEARRVLRELDWGIVADPTPEGVALGIEALLAAPAPEREADPGGRFDRVNLARRLAAVFDEVTGDAGSGGGLSGREGRL